MTFLQALAAVQPETSIGLPLDASKHGHHIDWLLTLINVFTGVLFVIMVAWLLIAVIKYNKHHQAKYDHGDAPGNVKATLVLAASIFLVVDGTAWLDSTLDIEEKFWNYAYADTAPGRVRVMVNAHQWAWDFRQAGADDKFGTPDDIVTLNELRVPVDRPIILQMGSVDVIHSLYLPNMRAKADVVPGHLTNLWFHPVRAGDYDIGCTQHCGQNHYKMKALLKVVSADEHAAWVRHASAIAVKAYDKDDAGVQWAWEWKSAAGNRPHGEGMDAGMAPPGAPGGIIR